MLVNLFFNKKLKTAGIARLSSNFNGSLVCHGGLRGDKPTTTWLIREPKKGGNVASKKKRLRKIVRQVLAGAAAGTLSGILTV